eukprot:COSAG04_NODE_23911_length_330_cov_0.761905_1_plen_22_part_01
MVANVNGRSVRSSERGLGFLAF